MTDAKVTVDHVEDYEFRIAFKADIIMQKLADRVNDYNARKADVQADGAATSPSDRDGIGPDFFSHLKDWFAKFNQPDPASFDPIIEQYASMALKLGGELQGTASVDNIASIPSDTVAQEMASVRGVVEDWNGDGKDAFIRNFVRYYEESGQTVKAQRELINAFQVAMEAHRQVFVNTREDVEKIADSAIIALEQSDDGCTEILSLTLVVASAVATVASAGAASGALAWAVVAAAGSLGASILGASADDPIETTIEAETPQEILSEIHRLLDTLETAVANEEQKVADGVQHIVDMLSDVSTSNVLLAPSLLDAQGNYPLITDDYLESFGPP